MTSAVDIGAVGAFLVGNTGDTWTREEDVRRIGKLLDIIKHGKLIAGVAGHELRTPQMCEAGRVRSRLLREDAARPELLVEAAARAGQGRHRQLRHRQLLVPGAREGDRVHVRGQQALDRLQGAGGRRHPAEAGFKYAFRNGADFAVVGMFDFQVAENAAITGETVAAARNREREWFA